MAPVVVPGIDVPLLTGPLVLGYMWGYFLYGILVVQVYLYSERFLKEGLGIKALVWSMFTLETIFTIFTTIAAWDNYGPGWGDTETLFVIDWSWAPLPVFNCILAAMAQSFYIWRIWRLTNKRWLPVLIGCVMLTQVTACLYYGIRHIQIDVEGRSIEKLFALSPEITLSSRKRHTTFQRTSGVINRLIRFSVETGSVTSVGALVEATLWLTCRRWNFHFILYSNMLMATVNCRAPTFQTDSMGTSALPQSSFWAEPIKPARGPNLGSFSVHISHTKTVTHDPETILMSDFSSNSDTGNYGKGIVPDKSPHQLMA
ncbi:hypothetical protein DFH07DRAFT_772647 [Mycena maculata]|uniref:DUF6534 domain-containing protein n=1 Tax=Mycena maculata TaxID=230809 RepID=A0AAD7J6S4_9AGAR|nr:hypothetical protein DFH07DRAFT_772647 [Mycena maculata]